MIEINEKYVKGIAERFKKPLKITEEPFPKPKKVNKYLGLEGLE